MSLEHACVVVAALATTGVLKDPPPITIKAVDSLDVDKYCGTWYEIARFPNFFERVCDCNASALYTKMPDGTIRVANSCRRVDGSMANAVGTARKADPDGSNAKLEVRFAPSWLGWLPFVWGKYWVIDLPADYSYSVVSEPSRKYLWILSRTSTLAPATRDSIVEKLSAMGYDTTKLVYTRHDESRP